MSIAGGVWRALERARAAGANCVQVFVKSTVQWRNHEIGEDALEKLASARVETGIPIVAAHASYLVNLATSDRATRAKSISGLAAELGLARQYGIPWLVFHGGNHMGAGLDRGIANVAEAVGKILARTDGPGLALEMTAGAGTAVASRFEEVAEIFERAGAPERLALCLDTAHLFAAGYDIAGEAGYAAMKGELRKYGLARRVVAIHTNDSKGALGSHVDRHAHIARGMIGRAAFTRLMRDGDFVRVPKILETPKEANGRRDWDEVSIALLRRLAKVRKRPATGARR
jgi:deoxyribonuclease-4